MNCHSTGWLTIRGLCSSGRTRDGINGVATHVLKWILVATSRSICRYNELAASICGTGERCGGASLRVDLVIQAKLTERRLCFLQFLLGNTTIGSDFGFYRELQSPRGSKLGKDLGV